MAVTLATMRVRFPEFALASDAYVSAFLDGAARQMDVDVWGDLFDDGQMFLAAHEMALTVAGQTAGLSNKHGESPYLFRYEQLVRIVARGPMAV
jgi:hypothetical protein